MALDFTLTEDLLRLRQTAQSTFGALREQYASHSAVERQTFALEESWAALAKCGYQAAIIPEQYGGTGRGLMAQLIIIEELAAAGLQSFLPILTGMGSAAIAQFGANVIKETLLPRIAAGDVKICIAATESEAGFNIFGITTFAENCKDYYVVNGSKIYISGVDIADYILLAARTLTPENCETLGLPKTAGISWLLVDTQADGVSWTKVPSRGEGVLSQFALQFNDVHVPVERLVGEEHGGATVMFQSFNPERMLIAATALGIARYCLELAVRHGQSRTVFGNTPIGAYQSIQHPLADVAIRADALRWTAYRAAWLFDTGAKASAVAEAANAAKYLASELTLKAVDAAIDTFGGKGFDEDYGLIHLWEFARFIKTAPISNALILNQVAERGLQLPRSY